MSNTDNDKRIHPDTFPVMRPMPWKVECPICGRLVNKEDLDEHMKEEHDDSG